MAPMRLTALLLSSCLAAAPSWASTAKTADCSASTYAHLNLSIQQGTLEGQCQWKLGSLPGLLWVDIVMFSAPVSKVRFSMPDPPFGEYFGTIWNFPHTGTLADGIELDVGCSGGGYLVLGTTLINFSGQNVSCTTWKVNDDVEVEDCYGNIQPAVAPTYSFTSGNDAGYCENCWQYCQELPPYYLHPVNGATKVPLNATLSWDQPAFQYVDDFFECYIRIGTSPDCSDAQWIAVPCDTRSIVLDSLQESTTYYWRASWAILAGTGCSSGTIFGGLSAVSSFTTAGPIAAEKTTWGHVKAMYRD